MITVQPATPQPPPSHPLEQPPTPPGADAPARRQVMLHIPSVRPLVVYVMLAINIGVFVLRALSPSLDADLLTWGANFGPAVIQEGQVYRLLTAMFLHAGVYNRMGDLDFSGLLHIVFNSYMIYVAGSLLERLFGHVRFTLIYLLGGLAGSVLSAVLSFPPVVSVGASGAVFAILTAQYVYLHKHRRLLGVMGKRQMANLVSLFVINAVFGLVSLFSVGGLRIDNLGHLGGALGGAALAWFISPYYLPRRHPTLPDALTVDDINPLNRRYNAVVIYGSALVLVLFIARLGGIGLQ